MGAPLKLENFAFHRFKPASFEVKPLEILGVRGDSGSGKTRLLRAIADLEDHQGSVFLGDIERSRVSGPEWRKRVGMLPSSPLWWHDTVRPHLVNSNGELLRALGFEPDVLEWEVGRLSSGEKQRLGLARLLCRDPEALLLDEPTANLDETNRRRVERTILDYVRRKEVPVLWVGHDAEQARRVCHGILTLSEGGLDFETIRS